MKIYHYNAETKAYIGESIADESPLEHGVFLIPADATSKKPPEYQEGKIRVFDGEKWIKQDIETIEEEESEEVSPKAIEYDSNLVDAYEIIVNLFEVIDSLESRINILEGGIK